MDLVKTRALRRNESFRTKQSEIQTADDSFHRNLSEEFGTWTPGLRRESANLSFDTSNQRVKVVVLLASCQSCVAPGNPFVPFDAARRSARREPAPE